MEERDSVPVSELKELINLLREQPKVYEILGEEKEYTQVRRSTYYECCGYIQKLIEGKTSIIEKL